MTPVLPEPHTDEVALRHVSAEFEMTVRSEADIVVSVAVADGPTRTAETLTIRLDDRPFVARPISADDGSRLHMLEVVPPGRLHVDYAASVSGSAPPPVAKAGDPYRYGRPSRYCQSDELGPLARSEFAGLAGRDLLDAVSSWVGVNVSYVPGSSRPTDGAVTTMLSRAGVCRDFAHLAVALLRANGVPARIASVFAPGLDPMDFHAVAEACLDGRWWVVDPTRLAPRASMLRIATGVDATDTAFITALRGDVQLGDLTVSAVAEPSLPNDDLAELVALG